MACSCLGRLHPSMFVSGVCPGFVVILPSERTAGLSANVGEIPHGNGYVHAFAVSN